MPQPRAVRRRAWRALSEEEKVRRLAELRARHQAQIETEARRLPRR
ncbi:hypothetical protein GHK92_09270 [Nocardioides sp. dk4132]|nr:MULTISPECIES: hypothetical protein [unclassified Nocardioides]MQW76064.1 hypothetical protein [Nocardioides sp. dk4132]